MKMFAFLGLPSKRLFIFPCSYRTIQWTYKQPHGLDLETLWLSKELAACCIPFSDISSSFFFPPPATFFLVPDGPSLSSLKSLQADVHQTANSTSFESVVITSVKAAHMWRTLHQSYSNT